MKNINSAIQHSNLLSFAKDSKGRCIYCQKSGVKTACQQCKVLLYCSQNCLSYDQFRHKKQQCHVKKVLTQPSSTSSSAKGILRMGLVGLENIGNTCYLNSSLQCLSHTIPLTQYFYEKHYKKEINSDNFLGSKGVLAQAYSQFVFNMWYGYQQVFKPDELKKVIGKINPQFSKFSQEDANQLLTMLIDIIHEDLNRIKERPNKIAPDILGKSMQQAAKLSWLHYCSYNQSIITDIMTGLFKSTICCRTCKKQSMTFEPFRTINLPVPNYSEQKQLKFYVLYDNFRKPVTASTIQYQLVNHNKFAQEAAKQIGEFNSKFKLYFLSQKNDICDCQSIEEIETFQTYMEDQQAFLIEMSPLQSMIADVFQLTCFFSRANRNIWVKRPFFINLYRQTGFSFQEKILQHLYNSVYRFPEIINIYGITGNSYKSYLNQMRQKKILKFKLLKIHKRIGRSVIYDKDSQKQLQQNVLILESMKKLIQDLKSEDSFATLQNFQNLSISQLQKHFQLKIQVTKQADKFFDFANLYKGIDAINKSKYKPIQKIKQQKIEQPEIAFQKCLDAFQSDQKLHSDIVWYCPWCQQERKANKKITIYKTPDILIFVFNRFKVRQDLTKEKKKRPISVPFQINLEKYVMDANPMSCYIEIAKKKGVYKEPPYPYMPIKSSIQIFQLYAFIQHEGQINQGHYSAYAKNNEQWYFFNDKKVEQVSQKKIRKNNAYILFYRRKKR